MYVLVGHMKDGRAMSIILGELFEAKHAATYPLSLAVYPVLYLFCSRHI